MTTKRNRTKKQMALAASLVDVNAFIALYATMLLKYNGNPIKNLKAELPKWHAQAQPFLNERPDIAVEFEPCYKLTTLLKKVSDAQIQDLAAALKEREFMAYLDKQIKVTKAQITFIKLLNTHTLTANQDQLEKTWDRVHRSISMLQMPALNAAFMTDVDSKGNAVAETSAPVSKSVTAAAAQCAAIVKAVAARSGCYLTKKEAQTLRATNPDQAATYFKLNKVINDVAIAEVKRLILQSGKDMVPIAVLAKQLQSKGVQNNLPTGFVGGQMAVVADKFVAYTAEGKELSGVPYGQVMMNPAYDPKSNNTFVLKQLNDFRNEYRTVEMNKGNQGSKFVKAAEYAKNEDAHRASWLRDMMLYDPKRERGRPTKDVVLATLLELLYVTRQRIGGASNQSKGEETFGLTTLQMNHISIKPTYVEYSYSGKKGATQSAKFSIVGTPEAVKLGEIMHALTAERKDKLGKVIPAKGASDLVFTHYIAGRDKPVTAGAVRDYMRDVHKLPIGPHGFRHAKATEMAKLILTKAKFKPGKCTQAEVDAWVKDKLMEVGRKLHHKNAAGEDMSSTAIKSYIDPEVMHDFYEKLGLRTLKGVPARGAKDDDDKSESDE